MPAQPPDVISGGPRTVPAWVPWLAVVVVLAAALAGAIVIAVHYHGETTAAHRQLHSGHTQASSRPVPIVLSSDTVALPRSGTLMGEVTVFAARSSAGKAQVIVTARISAGPPDSHYELFGGDCAGNAADHAWAIGATDSSGSADITGHPWTVSVSHVYYLVVGTPGLYQEHPGPAVRGHFAAPHGLSAVRPEAAPCAP
jgi:hypothetical protein